MRAPLFSNKLKTDLLCLAIPLALSAFTHLWNPIGFPSIHIDEAHYLRRTVLVINGSGPQESASIGYPRTYDHPYFGQLFLGGILKSIGYPYLYSSGTSASSIEMLYFIPRVIMGILAVLDTYLLYKIADIRYGRKVALFASILFAVMPATWILRRVYIDNLLMPFALSSLLLALYSRRFGGNSLRVFSINKQIIILLSGIFLGLAIYTKVPAFTFVPLIGSIIYFNSKKIRNLLIWSAPVFLIPLLWPLYSIIIGQWDLWVQWVIWQTERNKPLIGALISFFQIDPVIMIGGMAGMIFTIWKKDFFLIIWVGPFLLFSYIIGWVQYFHLILIFPPFCIGLAILIETIYRRLAKRGSKLLSLAPLVSISIFGLVISTMLVTQSVNSSYYRIYGAIAQFLPHNDQVTLIGSHWWDWSSFWITGPILHKNHGIIDPLFDPDFRTPVKTERVLFVDDDNFKKAINNQIRGSNILDIRELYRNSKVLAEFTDTISNSSIKYYPFNILAIMVENENRPEGNITLRSNY